MTSHPSQGADLVVRALTRRYGRVAALSDVDLTVPAGTVHGLIGPNGAGKTTLLGVLLGLVRADSGQLSLGEQPLRAAASRVPGGLAGSVEQPRFYGYLTARRNLEVLARLDAPGGLRPEVAMSRVGLERQAATKAARLSMGMRQRLAIAAALMRRPALLVLDEPTGGLDPDGAADLLHLVRGLAADGCSVVLSSHDLALVADVCDDVTVLVHGRVVRSAPVARLMAEAPPASYRLRTSNDRRALELIGCADSMGVESAGPGRGLIISSSEADLDAALAELVRRGIRLRELVGHRSPLHLLYERLTGGDGDPSRKDAA